jgi:Domain of unknown function (DUF3482)/50S ribosome-binding GTPase
VNPPRFAIVGHPNKGKSSIVATLAEDDAVVISPQPGTTTVTTAYPMRVDGEVLYELLDTPGFQRAREVLEWLDLHDKGAGTRVDTVREFLREHRDDPRFHDEIQLLEPLVDGAGILYVVDGSRPYGRQYEAEMEILRRSGRARMALINMIGSGDHVDEWRNALSQYFSIVRVFDAVRADFSKRIELLRTFGAIDEQWAAPLNRAADLLVAERRSRHRRAAAAIAELVASALTATETVALPDPGRQAEVEAAGREKLLESIRRLEHRERKAVLEIYRHGGLQTQELDGAWLAEDVFSKRSFSVFGLSNAQIAVTGAASGAVAGGAVDVAVGGASLLLGAGIGAAIGAAGTLLGARRLAKTKVLGQPLGGYELSVGPVTDPNLPWVLLSRAVLHARLVAERNHARRDELIVEAEGGERLASRLDGAARRRIDGLMRRIAKPRGDDTESREALGDAVAGLLADDA